MSNPLDRFFSRKLIPIWMMRQAGRYLPEYMEIRKKHPDFLQMCYSPETVCELTIQPIKRFDLDFAIIFSDILVVLDTIGFDVSFVENVGPLVHLKSCFLDLNLQKNDNCFQRTKLVSVYEAITKTRSILARNKPLIGFVGAPWTLACYACEGKSSKDFYKTKTFSYNNQAEFDHLMDLLTHAVIEHSLHQIEAGADIIKIFDSWSGILNFEDAQKRVLMPLRMISSAIKAKHPNIPIIWFPRGFYGHYIHFLKQDKKYFSNLIDCIAVDYMVNISDVIEYLDNDVYIQGNLDPSLLLVDDECVLKIALENLLHSIGSRERCIFNLGHGVLPGTKIKNVEFMCQEVRRFEKPICH